MAAHADQLGYASFQILQGPIQAQSFNRDGHLRIGPFHAKIVAVKRSHDRTVLGYPATQKTVAIDELVYAQRQIPVGRASPIIQAACLSVFVHELAEGLHAIAVSQLLPRREHVVPGRHTVLMGAIVVTFRHQLAGQDIVDLPRGL